MSLFQNAPPKQPFLFFIRRHKRLFTLGTIALFFTNAFDVLTPLMLKKSIDQIENHAGQESLLRTTLLFFGVLLGVALFRYLWRIYFGRFHHAVADEMRNEIYYKLTTLGPSFFQKKSVGELMALVTNDVNAFRMAIGPGALILADAIFLTLFIVPFMIHMSWEWTWKCLILIPLIPFIIQKVEKLIHERFKVQQEKYADLSGEAQQLISGIRVIKSYAQERNQVRLFNIKSRSYEATGNKVAMVDSLFNPVVEFMVATGSVILLWVGSPHVMREHISIGTLVAFQQYIQKLIWPMAAFGVSVSMIQQGRASYERIEEILKTETDLPDNGDIHISEFESVEFTDVSFSYPESSRSAVKNLNFKISAGEIVGVLGAVGAGKSTLVQLLCRLWPLSEGQIRINGLPLEKISRASLTKVISYIPQEAFLFSDTVLENVAFGLSGHFDFADIKDASETVLLREEIDKMPEGYNALLGERGVNLSGGQKQRLTMARALVRDSSLVIFDDSLSAVDVKTERQIVEGIHRLFAKSKTNPALLLISHRLATLKYADRLIVLNNGSVEAIGTHEELSQSSATYQEMWTLQNGGDAHSENSVTDASGVVS